MPISALISLKYWLQTGMVNEIHPSGLFILLAIVAVSLLLKKAFCSWLCPVGTLSESLWMLGKQTLRAEPDCPALAGLPAPLAQVPLASVSLPGRSGTWPSRS